MTKTRRGVSAPVRLVPRWIACGLVVGLVACSDDGEPPQDAQVAADGGHNIDLEGCEHLQQGPFTDVAAGADIGSAADIRADHHAYRLTLTPGQPGYARFDADAKGDHVLFLDLDLKLELQDDQGNALTIEESVKSVSACTIVKGKHTFELPAVGSYFFKLGPHATATKVTAVIEELAHAH